MSNWLKRIRGAILMGLTWAAIWMPAGLLLGFIVDPDGKMDEPWILVGTLPGFLTGVIFSIVLGIAARRHDLRELSTSKVAAWGALAGLTLGSLALLLGDHGPNMPRVLPLDLVIIGSITVLSALSAAGSLLLAKKSEGGAPAELTAGSPEFEVAERDAQELPLRHR